MPRSSRPYRDERVFGQGRQWNENKSLPYGLKRFQSSGNPGTDGMFPAFSNAAMVQKQVRHGSFGPLPLVPAPRPGRQEAS